MISVGTSFLRQIFWHSAGRCAKFYNSLQQIFQTPQSRILSTESGTFWIIKSTNTCGHSVRQMFNKHCLYLFSEVLPISKAVCWFWKASHTWIWKEKVINGHTKFSKILRKQANYVDSAENSVASGKLWFLDMSSLNNCQLWPHSWKLLGRSLASFFS